MNNKSESAQSSLYSWNDKPSCSLSQIRFEEDIRDGLQGAYVRSPSLAERKELLRLSLAISTTSALLIGFPASSKQEFTLCHELLAYLQSLNIDVDVAFLARLHPSDIGPILKLKHLFPEQRMRAECFLGVSVLREKVEQWNLSDLLQNMKQIGIMLQRGHVDAGLSLEDASRTQPERLQLVVQAALAAGYRSLAICDTVGESEPSGVMHLTQFVSELIRQSGVDAQIIWHGHNDKGLAVANAMAAATSGANLISGTYTGVGERSGNIPLEQVAYLLYEAGNRHHDLTQISVYCQRLSQYIDVPIGLTAPIIGEQNFTTSAGTHAAAILKAKEYGEDFEDSIFSAVPARCLGRSQHLLIGPASGRSVIRYELQELGYPTTEENIETLLAAVKKRDRWISRQDIQTLLSNSNH